MNDLSHNNLLEVALPDKSLQPPLSHVILKARFFIVCFDKDILNLLFL